MHLFDGHIGGAMAKAFGLAGLTFVFRSGWRVDLLPGMQLFDGHIGGAMAKAFGLAGLTVVFRSGRGRRNKNSLEGDAGYGCICDDYDATTMMGHTIVV
ncbi:uncharacterized protein LOC141594821 [Silene latifolia]|uniref:uncharacterized protein LOC141594821 n=1 Tax=Silene latifolia TaxID=37657 RepID=UPI003D7898D3